MSNNVFRALLRSPERESDAEQLNRELSWAASRPGSRWHDKEAVPTLASHGLGAFEECLTDWEAEAYQTYMQQYPDCVYALNQNPTSWPIFSKGQAARC